MPFSSGCRDGGTATYHDAGWYGGWAAVWHYMRAWVPALRARQIARLGRGGGFAYQQSLRASWDRIAASHIAVRLHAQHTTLLPAEARFPDIFSILELDHGPGPRLSRHHPPRRWPRPPR